MAQVIIRRLDEKVLIRLKKRARERGRSFEAEVRSILEEAVPDYEEAWKRIEQFYTRSKLSEGIFSDRIELDHEDQDR